MPRYIIDIHDDGPALWDEEGHVCAGRADIESRVRHLLTEARARQTERGSHAVTTTAFVHHEVTGLVLTVVARPDEDARFVWSPP